MTKIMAVLVALFGFFVSSIEAAPSTLANSLAASSTMIVLPDGHQLQWYPLMPGPLTAEQQAHLALRPAQLFAPWTGYNWSRAQGRFVLETLPPLTMVLVDQVGRPLYKADCGNRLVELPAPATTSCATCAEEAEGAYKPLIPKARRDPHLEDRLTPADRWFIERFYPPVRPARPEQGFLSRWGSRAQRLWDWAFSWW